MGHYAKVVNGIVQQVIVADADFFETYQDTSPGVWIQTSYNTMGNVHYSPETGMLDGGIALRGNYAGIGYIYDDVNDVFYPPRPYKGWIISEETNWIWTAPVSQPVDGRRYEWNEEILSWVLSSETDSL